MKKTILVMFCFLTLMPMTVFGDDPLPSWNEGVAKKSIIKFVESVTDKNGPHFVPKAERIATFDNDGTLWSEKPIYFQFAFVLDRIKSLAPKHPEWTTQQPFKAVLENDFATLKKSGKKGLVQLLLTTHSGMTTDEFDDIVKHWLKSANHPRFKRPYTELIYQPMLEVLTYLRANGFKTYIVSGGGIEFMRPWTEKVYGIPPEQVVGSSIKTKYEMINGQPGIVRIPEMDFINDKEGKPLGINKHIGRRPIAAFGNSDGDLEMIQWTTAGRGKRFGLYVHHTDEIREWAYDRNSSIGRLDKGLVEANKHGWTVVDMKKDWKLIYPFEKK